MAWQYRRSITINPATPKANFQVKLTLTTINFDYSHCNADGSDIRFKNIALDALSYWIESWDNTGDSVIWAKVTTITTSSIWLYYGNADATTESSGDDTFDFFDDFESRDIGEVPDPAKWTITEPGSNLVRIAADPDNAGNKVLKLYQLGGDGETILSYDINKTFTKNEYIIQQKVRFSTTPNNHVKNYMQALEDATACLTIRGSEVGGGYKFQWYDGGAYQNYVAHLTILNATWYSLIDYIGLASYIRRKPPDNYTGGFRNAIVTGINLFKFYQYHDLDTVTNYIDNVIVRQYAYPEPASSIGAEVEAPEEGYPLFYHSDYGTLVLSKNSKFPYNPTGRIVPKQIISEAVGGALKIADLGTAERFWDLLIEYETETFRNALLDFFSTINYSEKAFTFKPAAGLSYTVQLENAEGLDFPTMIESNGAKRYLITLLLREEIT